MNISAGIFLCLIIPLSLKWVHDLIVPDLYFFFYFSLLYLSIISRHFIQYPLKLLLIASLYCTQNNVNRKWKANLLEQLPDHRRCLVG